MFARPYGAAGGEASSESPISLAVSQRMAGARALSSECVLDPESAAALLADLGCLGPLWMEVGNPALTLTFPVSLPVQVDRTGSASVSLACGGSLQLLLVQWGGIRGDAGGCGLTIEDAQGKSMMRFVADPSAAAGFSFAYSVFLKTYGGLPRIRLNLAKPVRPKPLQDAAEHPVWERLAQVRGGCTPVLNAADVAELTGLLGLEPRRLRAMGRATAIDPALIAGLMDICVDQQLPIWCMLGNGGLLVRRKLGVQSVQMRRERRWLCGADLALNCETEGIDSAWVLESEGRRQIRLYDSEGRALGILEPELQPDGGETPLWRRLIDALIA